MDFDSQVMPLESAGSESVEHTKNHNLQIALINKRTIKLMNTIVLLSVLILLGIGCGIATTVLSGIAVDNSIKIMTSMNLGVDAIMAVKNSQNSAAIVQKHKLYSFTLDETIKICFGDESNQEKTQQSKSMLRFMLSENGVSRSDMYGNALKFISRYSVTSECVPMIYITVGLSESSGELPEQP